MAFRDFLDFLLGLLDKFKGRIALVNRPDIYQVMGCLSLFQLIDLGGTDGEFLIDLLAISRDDFTIEALGQFDAQGRFSNGRWTNQDNYFSFHRFSLKISDFFASIIIT